MRDKIKQGRKEKKKKKRKNSPGHRPKEKGNSGK
jgi:hypothetical protein